MTRVSNPPPTMEQIHRNKHQEVIDRFRPQFIDNQYNRSAQLYKIIELLVRDYDPYMIIEELIKNEIDLTERMNKLLESKPITMTVCDRCSAELQIKPYS